MPTVSILANRKLALFNIVYNHTRQDWHMGVEDDKPVNTLEDQPEIPEQEPVKILEPETPLPYFY